MIRILAAAAIIAAPPQPGGDPWFGADKVKHFLTSALIQSAAFSVARGAGFDKPRSQLVGGVAVASFGLWKEIYDRRSKRAFSVKDLIWDAAGGVAAASLLNRTR